MKYQKRRLSFQTVRNSLKIANYQACRPLKHPHLSDRHIFECLMWCRDQVGWNWAYWRSIHWSDECRMLSQVTDDQIEVWDRIRVNLLLICSSYPSRWWRISNNMGMCFMWMQTGSGDWARNANWVEILHMDDNTWSQRVRAVVEFLQQEAIATLPWRLYHGDSTMATLP